MWVLFIEGIKRLEGDALHLAHFRGRAQRKRHSAFGFGARDPLRSREHAFTAGGLGGKAHIGHRAARGIGLFIGHDMRV